MIKMRKEISILLVALLPSVAYSECALRSTTVANTVAVTAMGEVQSAIVPAGNGQRKCIVSFRAMVDSTWHLAHGEAMVAQYATPEKACQAAVMVAERDLVRSIAPTRFSSEDVMICNDAANLQLIQEVKVGAVGNAEQFRPHPDFPGIFAHMGVACRWILNVEFNSKLRRHEGIACNTAGNQWVVVDLF